MLEKLLTKVKTTLKVKLTPGWVVPWVVFEYSGSYYLRSLETDPNGGGTTCVYLETTEAGIIARIHPDDMSKITTLTSLDSGYTKITLIEDLSLPSQLDRRIDQRLSIASWAGRYNKRLESYLLDLPLEEN